MVKAIGARWSIEECFETGKEMGLEDYEVRCYQSWYRHITLVMIVEACLAGICARSEEHTSELQSRLHLVCRLLLEKKKKEYSHIIKRKRDTNMDKLDVRVYIGECFAR